jgi:ribosomal protein L7/L12
MADPTSFFFANAKPGEPLSYGALQTRRKIAEQLMGKRSPFPKTFGEGLTYLGESIGDVMQMRGLDAAEKQQAAYEANVLRGGPPLPGSENTAVATAAPPAASLPTPSQGSRSTLPTGSSAPLEAGTPGSPLEKASPSEGGFNYLDAAALGGGYGPRFRTERNAEVASRVGIDKAIQGINPEMQARMMAAYNAMPDDVKKDFVYNEGSRPRAYQQYLYDTRAGRGLVAPPGSSRHETGEAVDVDRSPALDWLKANGAQFGLAGIPGDYPHVQMARGGRQFLDPNNPATLPIPGQSAVPPMLPGSRDAMASAIVNPSPPGSMVNTPAPLSGGTATPDMLAPGGLTQPGGPIRTAALTPPGVASDAGPASAALPAPQPVQTPLIPGGPPIPSPIPLAPPEVRTPGVQTAQAGGAAVPPPIEPRNPGPQPTMPPPTLEMQRAESIAKNRMLSPDTRAQYQAKYNELLKTQRDVFLNDLTTWKQEVIKFHDPATGLGLREKQLAVVKAVQDLEGEGWRPVPAEKMAQLPKVAEGQTYWENRRGELKFGPRPPATTTVNIDQKAEGKGLERLQTEMADHIVGQFKEGTTAADDLRTLSGMRALAARVDTGAPAVIKQFAGKFGIKTEGISDIEALNATINRIVPQQRVPGTGATSDFDARMFQASVPHLMNTRDGNMLIMDTMESVAKNKLARAEIAGKVISGDLKIADGTRELLKLQAEAKTISDNVRSYLENTGVKLPEPIIPSQTDADEAARKFLRENPNHPKAEGVRRSLGIR